MSAPVPAAPAPQSDRITLGLLAGGGATRLQGMDKAWMQLSALPQAERWQHQLRGQVATCIASANRHHERYAALGMASHSDEFPGLGPIEGLRILAVHCPTPWLFTLPVDIAALPDSVLPDLVSGTSENGACLRDADGLQPLVALWRRDSLRVASTEAVRDRRLSVQALCQRLGMAEVHRQDVHVGNINTPEQLSAARSDP